MAIQFTDRESIRLTRLDSRIRKAISENLSGTGWRRHIDDVTQEALLELHERWRKDNPYGCKEDHELVALAVRIATRKAIAIDRRGERESRKLAAFAREQGAATSELYSMVDRLSYEDSELLGDLSPAQHADLLYKVTLGLSLQEIADLTGTSKGTVQRHLERAKDRLRPSFAA